MTTSLPLIQNALGLWRRLVPLSDEKKKEKTKMSSLTPAAEHQHSRAWSSYILKKVSGVPQLQHCQRDLKVSGHGSDTSSGEVLGTPGTLSPHIIENAIRSWINTSAVTLPRRALRHTPECSPCKKGIIPKKKKKEALDFIRISSWLFSQIDFFFFFFK